MKVCPKCQRTVADESKICRVCGSILDMVHDPPPGPDPVEVETSVIPQQREKCVSLSDLVDRDTNLEEHDPRNWICPNCREQVEHNFDLCWKCGTDREGVSNLEFVTEDEYKEGEVDEEAARPELSTRTCVRCGSQRVIPSATIHDQGQHSDGKLYALILGNPDALVFRDRMYGEIRADICGDCGHVELHAPHAARLYEHYLRSLEQ